MKSCISDYAKNRYDINLKERSCSLLLVSFSHTTHTAIHDDIDKTFATDQKIDMIRR